MIKFILYINIIFILSCSVFDEQVAPLEGKFYIQDGWLAFSSQLYNESIKHFNTAIETRNDPISIPTNVTHGDLGGGSYLSFILLNQVDANDCDSN